MVVDLTPYSTAKPFFGPLESWLPPDDAERLASYQLYEAIYKNVPEAFRVIQRGTEQNPIYIPSGKTIVEACNRYLAKRWTYALVPDAGTDEERATLGALLQNTFIRENMYAKFATQKKWGLIRGDAIWHITADENKDLGKRISIHELDPGSYFPIYDPVDDSKVVGCHLVDQFDKGEGKGIVLRRQTYRRDSKTKKVSYEITWWEMGAWDDRENSGQKLKVAAPPADFVGVPAYDLPDEITQIPVYHVKNERSPNAQFGTSELSGLERVIASINQSISDEELALVLEGLGLYSTTSGPPTDPETDEETEWQIGPGYVVEIDPDSNFTRVNGVGSITPMQDHIGYLEKTMREASGTPDIAIGIVDSAVAESGVALQLKMSPLLSKNEEKEQVILGTMDQMMYDLVTMWFAAYEELVTPARVVSIIDDPLPVNRDAILGEIILLLTNNIISIPYAQQMISEKLGYEFPTEMLEDIVTEQAQLAAAKNTDPFTARVAKELDEETA